MDDELKNTFLYIRSLSESSKEEEIVKIYETIGRGLSECKKRDMESGQENSTKFMDYYWAKCKKKLIAGMDVLTCLGLYTELAKNGYSQQFMEKICKHGRFSEVLKPILIDKICRASRYLVPRHKYNLSLKISIESSDEINMINMSKTMKQLYCSICMVYDCGKHALSD